MQLADLHDEAPQAAERPRACEMKEMQQSKPPAKAQNRKFPKYLLSSAQEMSTAAQTRSKSLHAQSQWCHIRMRGRI